MHRRVSVFLQMGLLILISGCVDYGADYIYIIENKLNQPVEVSYEVYFGIQVSDTVNSLTAKEIFRDFFLCGKDFVPQKEELPFRKIEIYHGDSIKIPGDFRDGDLWSFSGKKYEGRYLLIIDPALLK